MPLLQNESKCETFLMKMSSAYSFIFMQIKVIFIRMVSHLDSLWNRGTRELGNGLFRLCSQANQNHLLRVVLRMLRQMETDSSLIEGISFASLVSGEI